MKPEGFEARHARAIAGQLAYAIDFDWLSKQPVVTETDLVRHVRVTRPLVVRDGRSGRGVVLRGE